MHPKSLDKLKDFQRQWSEIGFVPLKDKDEVHEKYREAINKKFDELHIDDSHRNMLKFKTKLEELPGKTQWHSADQAGTRKVHHPAETTGK